MMLPFFCILRDDMATKVGRPHTRASLSIGREHRTSAAAQPAGSLPQRYAAVHIHGIVAAIFASLHTGASVVCSSGFRGRHFFQWLQEFQPSWYTAVPTMHTAIVARAAQHSDKRHSLRFIRSCSAPLPGSVLRDLEQRFGVPVLEVYGMTEAAHQIACNPLPPAIRKPSSIGVPTGTEITILDELGRPLEPDC
jgi:acyl-CoA synthetase (AMP-forming)/AMP-acid ligase II